MDMGGIDLVCSEILTIWPLLSFVGGPHQPEESDHVVQST